MEKMPQNEQNPFLNEKGIEQPFSKEGLLNRNFGKDATLASEATVYSNGFLNRAKFNGGNENRPLVNAESSNLEDNTENQETFIPEEQLSSPESSKENILLKEEKKEPLMATFVQAYQGLSEDPESSALNAMYHRLEPNLTDLEKREQIKILKEEYEEWKKQ